MGFGQTVSFMLLLWGLATYAAQSPVTGGKTEGVDSAVQALLREASELALKQDEAQRFWCDRVLLQIGNP
jgi:hypothetical protein